MTKSARQLLLLGSLLLACTPGVAGKPMPISGLFGDVRESRETGDFSGVELEIFSAGSEVYVDFVLCEGACNGMQRIRARREGNDVMFDYVEQTVFSDGKPAPPTYTYITATVTQRGVRLRSTGYLDVSALNVPRISRRYGLAMASANQR